MNFLSRCNAGISPFMLAENRGRIPMMIGMLRLYQKEATKNKDSLHPYLTSMCTKFKSALDAKENIKLTSSKRPQSAVVRPSRRESVH